MEYYTYGYPKDVPLIAKTCCCSTNTDDIEAAVTNAIMNFMPTINDNFGDVHTHIDTAKDEILSAECDGCGCSGCSDCSDCGSCNVCLATKCDISQAVKKINEHIDSKFDEIDFLGQFSDLNAHIEMLMN